MHSGDFISCAPEFIMMTNSRFFFLGNNGIRNYDYMFELFSGVTCNRSVLLNIGLIFA